MKCQFCGKDKKHEEMYDESECMECREKELKGGNGISKIIQFLSDEELDTSNKALEFDGCENAEFMRGKAHEAKRIRTEIHKILNT